MKIYDISPEAKAEALENVTINGITDDTSRFNAGDVFVCIKGINFDGHDFAEEMLEKGASMIICERDLGLEKQLVVKNTRAYFSKLASNYYGNPTKELKLIGVTGTNGKSTITALLKQILETLGYKTGTIGTVGYDVITKVYEAHLTTPRQMDLYRYFREMADNGAEYCVVEASSQALSQSRFDEENFECAVFTNLTQDHLDWHKTMERYYLAKRSLFDRTKRALICIDDKYGEKLLKYVRKTNEIPVATYSAVDTADYYAVNIKTDSAGVNYWLSAVKSEKSFPAELGMPGVFNVGNSIAAVAVCTELGFYINEVVDALKECKCVRGRSEVIYNGDFTVICDYAHTEDALEKFLGSVRSFAPKRIICVFGAAGERDTSKRKSMGEAVARICDYVIVTSDNPRFEDQQSIIDNVIQGVIKQDTPYKTFTDRKEAIKAAISEAEKGDIITLCGKGHETYQVIDDRYEPFDEREIVAELVSLL